ncbi:MAG: putative membrane protein YfcA [Paracoccaceae bacterium]|jgi:uncharacterized membrane protein YfcA
MDIMNAFLPGDMAPVTLLALLAISFSGSFITVAFGIGGGILLLAVFATLLPPAALIPVHGVVQIGSNLGRTVVMFRYIHWAAAPGFMVGTVIGATLGGAMVVSIPPAFVQIGVGLFIVWSVLFSPPAIFRRWGALTGGIASFLTMFFGATGPFVASYVKSFKLDRLAHVATHATLMSAQHGVKTLAFAALGFAFGPWILFIGAMIAAGVLGTLAGKRVLARISDNRFRLILDVVLLLLAARLVFAGTRILWSA